MNPDLDQDEARAQKRRRRKKKAVKPDALPSPNTDLDEASCSAPEAVTEESAPANPEQDEASAQKRRRRKHMLARLGKALSGGLFVDDDDLGEASAQKRRRRHSRGALLRNQDRLPEAGDDDLGEASAQERRRRPSRGSQSATARIIGRQLDSNPLDDESCPRV